jgi:hypothetical protein
MILIAIVIGVVAIYAAGYSAGKQSIRGKFRNILDGKSTGKRLGR